MADAPYAHIACCVDDSDASRLALREAARLRALGPGRLSVLHAIEGLPMPSLVGEGASWYPDDETYERRVAEWLVEFTGLDDGEPVVLRGYPAAAIVDWGRENGVDLLVAAAHRGRVERLLLGSFASYLAHHAASPVLLVRPQAAE